MPAPERPPPGGGSPASPTRRFPLPRLTIGRRFGVVVPLVVLLVASVCVIGANGVSRMNDQVSVLYGDEYTNTLNGARLARSLRIAEVTALQAIESGDGAQAAPLNRRLDRQLLPAVDAALARLRSSIAHGGHHDEIGPLNALAEDLDRFDRLRGDESRASGDHAAHIISVSTLFERMAGRADDFVEDEAREAHLAYEQAGRDYRSTLLLLVGGSLLALLGALGVIAWLTRSIVPRARGYSLFAADVASGSTARRLDPAGRDELTELGVLLNQMVDHREREQHQLGQQTEFSEAMQMTESEEEAYGLLKRHLERSLEQADVTVLGRNNSADRLEARTPVRAGAPLAEALAHAKPRSCLAVRTAEQQNRTNGEVPLMECEVCGQLGPTACQPLLVGGEVMGSVLALTDGPMTDGERETMRLSVAQAAPILANLRNLAIAEQRAGTDELTGLPNQRAANDAVKRMVAEASASAPLAALVLDLDHFKQINDVFGHGAGDEVLAAVGAALRATLRPDDFCARWGGEEFLLLLPSTDPEGARAAGELVRAAVGRTRVASVQRDVSASVGVAVLPFHALDAQGLVRSADRALYAAKAGGRDRVELFADLDHHLSSNGAGANADQPTQSSP